MEARKKVEGIIQELAENLNLGELKLNEEGYCSITFDDKVIISFEFFKEKKELFIYSPLGEIPPTAKAELGLYREICSANFFWQGTGGATICVENKTKMVVAFRKFPVDELSYPLLESELELFVNFAEVWFHRIRDLDFPTAKEDPSGGKIGPGNDGDQIKV